MVGLSIAKGACLLIFLVTNEFKNFYRKIVPAQLSADFIEALNESNLQVREFLTLKKEELISWLMERYSFLFVSRWGNLRMTVESLFKLKSSCHEPMELL